ncbi:hypothetical protein RRG08_019017 [Elysia crispata]|uniref:Uncharacterized protein n=1 Tax=Elysia crispata TaxID=231223 RepID=A0AAE1A6J0_9GAST|nr:hypothetical protein RRG08_019017 [Elysia crispata]
MPLADDRIQERRIHNGIVICLRRRVDFFFLFSRCPHTRRGTTDQRVACSCVSTTNAGQRRRLASPRPTPMFMRQSGFLNYLV